VTCKECKFSNIHYKNGKAVGAECLYPYTIFEVDLDYKDKMEMLALNYHCPNFENNSTQLKEM